MKLSPFVKKTVSTLLAVSMAVALTVSTATPALAADDKRAQLQAQKDEAQEQLDALNQQISENAANRENAEELKAQYEEQADLILGQIGTLTELIGRTEGEIYTKEQEITAKQAEVDQKQAEYDTRREGFKDRLRAMQKLNDGGSIALLSTATNLYELLTFADTLDQMSSRDEEICNDIEAQRVALEQQRTELENAKAELETYKAELDSQNAELEGKHGELAVSIQQQNDTISEADAREDALEASAAEARKKLDEAAAELDAYLNSQISKYSQAAMTCSLNFGPALPSYKYISCAFGGGGHRGTDFAAAGGHRDLHRGRRRRHRRHLPLELGQLRADLPRQRRRGQHLLHAVRPHEQHPHRQRRAKRLQGPGHRVRGHHRQLHRQPPPP